MEGIREHIMAKQHICSNRHTKKDELHLRSRFTYNFWSIYGKCVPETYFFNPSAIITLYLSFLLKNHGLLYHHQSFYSPPLSLGITRQ